MKNVLAKFCYDNELSIKTVSKITGIGNAQVYRLTKTTNEKLTNMRFKTYIRLTKIGFNLTEELKRYEGKKKHNTNG